MHKKPDSRMLFSDILTEFKDRGDEIRVNIIPWHDEHGILYIGIEQFLLEENAVDI